LQYLSVAEARGLSGLRLVLTAGVPGPWGEAAKAVFGFCKVPFAPVAQQAMAPNDELVAWTGHRNAPIACLDDAPPLTGWHEILLLAEELGQGPSLLPADPAERALCLGLCLEVAGRDGLGWNRRLQIMAAPVMAGGNPALEELARTYGVTRETIARAPARNAAILSGLAAQLQRQANAGSGYLVGSALSAADLYWACFSMMVAPLPQAVNPMPDWLRTSYADCDPVTAAALDPLLIAHRDRIYAEHIGLPLDY
jgi:glutathione S-transferase